MSLRSRFKPLAEVYQALEAVWRDLHRRADAPNGRSPGAAFSFSIALEANIGAGKSTLLRILQDELPIFKVITEPVDAWTHKASHFGGTTESALSLFYQSLDKPTPPHCSSSAYLFQNFAFVSKYVAHCQNSGTADAADLPRIRFIERSLFGDAHVFWEKMREDPRGLVSELEVFIYSKWYEALMTHLSYRIDGFIYLRTDPEICLRRVHQRMRPEEQAGVSIDYLQGIHVKLEQWLTPPSLAGSPHPRPHGDFLIARDRVAQRPVLVIDGSAEFEHDERRLAEVLEKIVRFTLQQLQRGGATVL